MAILQERLGDGEVSDITEEARRQSRLVSRRRSDRVALAFALRVADLRSWR